MLEMIRNAWRGWQGYTGSGKLAALAIVVLLYLWLCSKQKGPGKRLLLYGIVFVILCVCPLTAAFLMYYQTRFYDYQWIWSMVPLTALIAWGGTVFLTGQWKMGKGWRGVLHNTIVTLASVAILLLCGGLGQGSVGAVEAHENRTHSENVLAKVQELCGEDICLWAPANILEYARLDGKMQLLYGRNMWDVALNAYSYDAYSKDQIDLYEWMEHLDDWDIKISAAEVEMQVQKAFAEGADCILLPDDFVEWMPEAEDALLEQLKASGNVEVIRLEEYYLLKLR